MTLWHVLILTSGAASFGSAWTAAQAARPVGNPQFLLAVLVGAVIAVGCAAILEALGRLIFPRLVKEPERPDGVRSFTDIVVPITYLFAVAWSVASGFLGYWLTSLLVAFVT